MVTYETLSVGCGASPPALPPNNWAPLTLTDGTRALRFNCSLDQRALDLKRPHEPHELIPVVIGGTHLHIHWSDLIG